MALNFDSEVPCVHKLFAFLLFCSFFPQTSFASMNTEQNTLKVLPETHVDLPVNYYIFQVVNKTVTDK